MDRTLTLNSQKGQRKQTGKSTYHKNTTQILKIMPLIDAKSLLLKHWDGSIVQKF